jgi:predicted Zn-dependent peptidase
MSPLSKVLSSTVACLHLAAFLSIAPAAAQDLTHPREMQLPEPTFIRPDPGSLQLELDNGLMAYIAEDHRAPLVSITAYIGVGSGHGKPGEAAALAAALRRGPASMRPGEFLATLAQMDALYKVTQGHEETQLYLDVPAEDVDAALRLMAAVLSAPAFEGAVPGSTPRVASGAIDYAYSLQDAIALFEQQLFAGHAFRRTPTATERTDAGSSGAQVLHAGFFRGGNITLAIAGDFSQSKARQQTRSAFSVIAPGDLDRQIRFPALMPQPSDNSRTLLLSEADRDQGWVVIGHELPPIPEEDEAALHVMDYILGAYHLDSRLYRSSRELRGLTNDNSSFLEPGIHGPGAYSFRTYGRPEAVRLLVDVTFRQLELMRSTPVTDDELFVAKGALVDGIYAERYATGLDAANAYAIEWLRKGNHKSSASYPARVAAVSIDQVQAAAQKYLHPQRMIVAVLGPLERIHDAPAIESEPQLDHWGTAVQ